MSSLTVTIIRHGQTDFDFKSLINASFDCPINETGRIQARKLGSFLSKEKYTRVFSSDFQRCVDTAQCVLSKLTHETPEIVLDERLREKDYVVFKKTRDLNVERWSRETPGELAIAEKAPVKNAVVDFFQELFQKFDGSADEEVLVCSHCLSIQSFLRHLKTNEGRLYSLENFNFQTMKYAGNTSRTKFRVAKEKDGIRLITFKCVHDESHLCD